MKFTLSWLKTHLDTNASAAELADKLTAIGLEVESLTNKGAALAPFLIAEILTAEQHPNADRLRVCSVNTGKETVQVVCGASNARAGLKTVFGAPGTFVPGANITLKISKIRDVESRGMLCSARELELSEQACERLRAPQSEPQHNLSEGIMELPANAPVGSSFADYAKLDDPLFEIKLTPNRADCNGVYGIARDLAAAGMGRLKPLAITAQKAAFKSRVVVRLDFPADAKNACSYFIGREIRGVKNGPSPEWLQERLTSIGLKPISALVDITNFMAYEHARPLHVFDADKVSGAVTARLARTGETLLALNEKEVPLDDSITIIADDKNPLAIAGIMGGQMSGCTNATTTVFLECAAFDPARTTLAGRKLQILSDARYRFERGIDENFMRDATELATQLILECCGGEASELIIAGAPKAEKARATLRHNRCKTLGGLDIAPAEQRKILESLGCIVADKGNAFDVIFPSWRPDLGAGTVVPQHAGPVATNSPEFGTEALHQQSGREQSRQNIIGEADCVEEITRLKGYDAIAPVSLLKPSALTVTALSPAQKKAAMMRRALAARGLLETVTWSFMPSAAAQHFATLHPSVYLQNPISAELDVLRPSILPNLLMAARRNADRGFADVSLFEIGPVYNSAAAKDQRLVAAGLRMGAASPRQWMQKAQNVNCFDAKADALAALEAVKCPTGNLQVEPFSAGPVATASSEAGAEASRTQNAGPVAPQGAEASRKHYFHPGRSGVLRLGPNVLAHFGELHPAILSALDIAHPVCGFEVFLDALPPIKDTGPARPLADMPELQPVARDYAFVLPREVSAEKLLKAVRAADKDLIQSVDIFDVYEGKGVPEGQKSIALAVTLQPRGKTLTDADLEAFSAKVTAAAQKAVGAVLRG